MEIIIMICLMAALLYPFLKWNHQNEETPDYGPYELMDKDGPNQKITITGTLRYTIKEEKEKTEENNSKTNHTQSMTPPRQKIKNRRNSIPQEKSKQQQRKSRKL